MQMVANVTLKSVERADPDYAHAGWHVTFQVESGMDFEIPVYVSSNDAADSEVVKVGYERLHDLVSALLEALAPPA